MSALHIFDMDGTLLRGTSASIEISRRLDCLEHLRERGVDVVCASHFPPLPFREAVDPAGILEGAA